MAKLGSMIKKSPLGSLNVSFHNCINSRWFLYAVLILAASDLYIFAVNGELFFVALFVLIGFLTTFFSKNMSVILFVAMILTNILRFGKDIRVTEGMETGSGDGSTSAAGNTSSGSEITIPNMDNEDGGDFQFLEKGDSKTAKSKSKTKEPLIESIVSEDSTASAPSASPAANGDLATKLAIAEITKTLGASSAPVAAASPVAASTPTNDISKTIEGLDQDTMNLLQKQQKLLENMENLKPLLSNAERFLQNFNATP